VEFQVPAPSRSPIAAAVWVADPDR
jgi:hypothetical protein